MNQITSPNDMEPSIWHSAPLVFVILPALGGVLFQNGSAVVTDIILLAFASIFLNWCVMAPWDWYFAAQQVQYLPDENAPQSDPILEDGEGSKTSCDESHPESTEAKHTETTMPDPGISEPRVPKEMTTAQKAAGRELGREEIFALIACFLGPLLGACLLHTIRSQLTRPSEGLVSNYNLTIFVMAAELRPVSHIIKLKKERMMHLQRIVQSDPRDRLTRANTQEILKRLGDVEVRIAEPSGHSDAENFKVSANVRQSLQPQLDALNRAVRRYEKRQAAQSMQIEARFQDLDARLKDALSLAAAAARSGQRPGIISVVATWIVGFFTYCFQSTWAVVTYPFALSASIAATFKSWFVRPERQPQNRVRNSRSSYSSTSNPPKIQSRNGR
ncbi:hypothetical protein EJ04DRAFT_485949 [Polyplosphaeria fusca]|uniref:Uncharacterized protein n=1 Tax=Polyplosphaeria fusca TaxID=682080 RepID=A0A9P4R8S9_9PLEO|nr:hypothetical protein EJ04DRAFT_485949 [Polyplosphaeria fusca]